MIIGDSMVNIPYLEVQLYLMNKLNKVDARFNEDELKSVDELYLNPVGINNVYTKIDFNILRYFPKLKKLEISNSNIDNSVIEIISKLFDLDILMFNNCHISSVKGFYQVKIKSLGFNNCIVDDLENIGNMKSLNAIKLINMKLDSISFLESLPHLIEVDLSYSKLKEMSTLYTFILIERLAIDNSDIMDLDFVNKYSGLKEISISSNQYAKNKELIDDLVALGIIVYEDDVICYNHLVGGSNE